MSQTKAELIDAKGDANFDSGTLYVDATNNRVGINTTSASSTVHIVDSSSAGNGTIRLGGGSGFSGYYSTIQQDIVSNGKLVYNIVAAAGTVHGHQFQVDGTAAVTIDASRRVGIGTTSPSGRLTIANDAALNEIEFTGSDYTNVYSATTQGFDIGISNGSSTGPLRFLTANAERARIDSSGRLLVGTSSSRASYAGSLEIESTTSAATIAVTRNSADGSPSYLFLAKSRATSVGGNTIVSSGDNLGYLGFLGSDGTVPVLAASIVAQVDGTPGANDMPGRLVFSTTADGAASPTERMRIDNTGYHQFYGINDTIVSRTNKAAGVSYATFLGVHSATGPNTGTLSSVIWSNGNVQNVNGSYTTLSDEKLKENIVDAGSQWDDLKAIRIRNWNFKAETGHETHRQIGPIAQELETVCPGLVFETPDRDEDGNETGEFTKGVNQSILYMKAVKALQEAMERIEQLEAEMAEVKAQLS